MADGKTSGKKGKAVLRIIIILFVLSAFSNVMESVFGSGKNAESPQTPDDPRSSYESRGADDIKDPPIVPTSLPSDVYVPGCSDFYYSQLNEAEKKLYLGYLRIAMNGNAGCRILNVKPEDYTAESLIRISQALQHDRNDVLFLHSCVPTSDCYSSSTGTDSEGRYYVSFHPALLPVYKSTNLKDKSDALAAKVEELCAEANKFTTEYEKAVFVHAYICNIANYSFDKLEKINTGNADPDDYYISTAYGCLIEGDCICAGYARGFQAVMNALGIPCVDVSGFGLTKDGDETVWGAHAWNAVRLDGQYYYVDVTWDDGANSYDYDYFLIPQEVLEKNHCLDPFIDPFDRYDTKNTLTGFISMDELFEMPECNSFRYVDSDEK